MRTLLLSLKTMSKAFAGCRETYMRPKDRKFRASIEGSRSRSENYSKDMSKPRPC